jgi:hypothetical protein
LTKSAWRNVSTMFDELKALADKRAGLDTGKAAGFPGPPA